MGVRAADVVAQFGAASMSRLKPAVMLVLTQVHELENHLGYASNADAVNLMNKTRSGDVCAKWTTRLHPWWELWCRNKF
jgi:hypothetical protein